MLDPASLPQTVAGVHYAGPGLDADELLTGVEPAADATPVHTAWSVEVVYTSDHRFDDELVEELRAKHARGFRIILRVDYERKQPVPPADDPAAVARYVDTFIRYYERTNGLVRYFVVGNEGNVDAPGDDPGRVTECLAGRGACTPESYVAVYRQVRLALRSRTNAYLLVGPVSPGSADDPLRYADGLAYLGRILSLLHPLEVDGIALHAYGQDLGGAQGVSRSVDHLTHQLERQVATIAEAGMVSTPLFVTEMNQGAAADHGFVEAAYAWIDGHNRRSPLDIVAACWFVYHDETGQWRDLALEAQEEALAGFRSSAGAPPGR
jgi:hypothetical protein